MSDYPRPAGYWLPPVRRPHERVRWRQEAANAVVVTAFSTLLGGLVGVIWYALAPRLAIVAVAHGSSAPMKSLISDDVWLAFIGLVAGILCVAALRVVSPRASLGPGATLGLGVGGLLGMLVAARVGHLLGHPYLSDAIRAAYPGVSVKALDYYVHLFDYTVRAKAALLAWPFAAVALNTVLVLNRTENRPTPVMVSAYPGSS
ncbi:MAG TPA: hypothetical protein VHA79_06195 [Mycobacteriales bacterium]|nr:hypothetical protein [Mycobacteriales bacterium]HVX69265.1 hypothetical protein [Mycobacteriales bacterium]